MSKFLLQSKKRSRVSTLQTFPRISSHELNAILVLLTGKKKPEVDASGFRKLLSVCRNHTIAISYLFKQ